MEPRLRLAPSRDSFSCHEMTGETDTKIQRIKDLVDRVKEEVLEYERCWFSWKVTPLESTPTELQQLVTLVNELKQTESCQIEKKERILVTTLTIKMSEQLTEYLRKLNIKVQYLHSKIDTLDRVKILHSLRKGEFDVLVGINLLREGLDLPEVSLVAILDADKEGFLRSERALIQVSGRAARNVNGKVIMYADKITKSMKKAIDETNRRRKIQIKYNEDKGRIMILDEAVDEWYEIDDFMFDEIIERMV